MFRHRRKRFPIDALFIDAQAAPFRLVLENLMRKLINTGTGLARTGVARDPLRKRDWGRNFRPVQTCLRQGFGRQTQREPQAVRNVLPKPLRAPRSVRLRCASACRHLLNRWPAGRFFFPHSAVPHNLLNHLPLTPFHEPDNFHRRATFWTHQWVRFIHLLDQGRPPFPRFLGAWGCALRRL